MVAAQHLDQDILDELRIVMGNEFSALLQTFVQDSKQRVLAIQRELTAQDAVGLRAAAHSFKGSSSNMGARQLAQLCKQIEESALAGDVLACEPLLRELETEYRAVQQEVESLLA